MGFSLTKLLMDDAFQKALIIPSALGGLSLFLGIVLNPLAAPLILTSTNFAVPIIALFVLTALFIPFSYLIDRLHGKKRGNWLQYFITYLTLLGVEIGFSFLFSIFQFTWQFNEVVSFIALAGILYFWSWIL